MIQVNIQSKIHVRKMNSIEKLIQYFVKNIQFSIQFKNLGGKLFKRPIGLEYVLSAQIKGGGEEK